MLSNGMQSARQYCARTRKRRAASAAPQGAYVQPAAISLPQTSRAFSKTPWS